MPGIETVETYIPVVLVARKPELAVLRSVTVQKGYDLAAGTIVGYQPASGKVSDYNVAGAATATSPAAGADNQGANTMGTVTVDDDKTITEDWTVTCIDDSTGGSEEWSVVGSVSGNVGTATTAVAFSDTTTGIGFTIADPGANGQEGDVFTFSTTESKAPVAMGILSEDVDATDKDVLSAMYVKGHFIEANLTGLDADARVHLGARSVSGDLII